MNSHLDEEPNYDKSKLEVCQFCIEVFADLYELEAHHSSVHPNVLRTGYQCKICNPPGVPRTSMKTVLEHYSKLHNTGQKELKMFVLI